MAALRKKQWREKKNSNICGGGVNRLKVIYWRASKHAPAVRMAWRGETFYNRRNPMKWKICSSEHEVIQGAEKWEQCEAFDQNNTYPDFYSRFLK